MTAPLCIKLRCASWAQLESIHRRDLSRGSLFLKTANPPLVGTKVRVDITLPSATVIVLTGEVGTHFAASTSRAQGVDVALDPIPPSAMWIIENALQSEHRIRNSAGQTAGVDAAAPAESMTDGDNIVGAEQELLTALSSELESLRKMNPFQVLGVGYESGDADVRNAFADLTKRYHPDRFARYQSEQLRRLAAEIFILIRDAYRRLGDSHARASAQSAAGYSSSPRPMPLPRAQTAPVPPVPISRVTKMPEIASLAPAKPIAKPSVIPSLAPPIAPASTPAATTNPVTAHSIEALIDANQFIQAKTALQGMLKANPLDKTARAALELCEGMMALEARDRLEAAQRFEAVLEIDPSNERAARELADMRRLATNERKGLLTKLMNKKD
jgi:hypothetical protein